MVNCIILGRAEAFASKNGIFRSALDALGMGAGFFIALFTLSSIRELLGSGKILGYTVYTEAFTDPMLVMILPPGAFITLGLILGLSLIHISEPTRLLSISYAVFCLKKKQ